MDNSNDLHERLIAAVDLGTFRTALTVARVEGNNTQIIYFGTRPSKGIRCSEVFNPKLASEVIRSLIEEAEAQLGIKILQVVTSLPRYGIQQEDASATVTRTSPDDCITQEEVDMLNKVAQESKVLERSNRMQIYSAIAQSFSTGEYFQLLENDIIGVIGDEFTGYFKIFYGKKGPVTAITHAFNLLKIGIARTYFTPTVCAKAVLTEEEMSNGVALIDLGADVTSVSIFDKKVLCYYAAIPFGGNAITTDIRNECGISTTLAENIKCGFGGCMPDRLVNLGEKIIQIENDESGIKQIPVSYLSQIITAREREIIEAILYEIQKSDMAMKLRKGIVITGGGAEMLNISALFKEMSGYSVRKAFPKNGFVASGCDGIYDTDAATSAGLILVARGECINCGIAPEKPAEEPKAEENPTVTTAPVTEDVHEVAEGKPTNEEAKSAEGKILVPQQEEEKKKPAEKHENSKDNDKNRRDNDKEKPGKESSGFFQKIKFKFLKAYETATKEMDKIKEEEV